MTAVFTLEEVEQIIEEFTEYRSNLEQGDMPTFTTHTMPELVQRFRDRVAWEMHNDGAGARPWFLSRVVGTEIEYVETPAGNVRRFTYERALETQQKLNTVSA